MLLVEVLGELARAFDEGFAVAFGEGFVGPVAAVVVGVDGGGPVFVEGR